MDEVKDLLNKAADGLNIREDEKGIVVVQGINIILTYDVYCMKCILYNILLQNEEVCGNTIYSSSEASGVNHIHRSRRLR